MQKGQRCSVALPAFVVVILVLFFVNSTIQSVSLRNLPTTAERKYANDIFSILTSSSSNTNDNHGTCLSIDEELETLVNNAENVFFASPPKAGGTTTVAFAQLCANFISTNEEDPRDFVFRDQSLREASLTWHYEAPKVVADHVRTKDHIGDLASSVTDKSLIIYVHRRETDRLVSGIYEAVSNYYCGDKKKKLDERFRQNGIRTDEECVIVESNLVEMIKARVFEIGGQDIWSCDAFDAIEENKPNFAMVHMYQLDRVLQKVAKKHCPHLEQHNFHENDQSDKQEVIVRFDGGSHADVTLKDWLQKKKYLLEWSLGLHKERNCRGKFREVEKELFSCKDEALVLSKSGH